MKTLWQLLTTCLIVLLGSFPAQSAETTISAQRIANTARLLPLNKVTVGADDQYSSTLSADANLLVFTHKADLVASLVVQDMKSGETADLLPLTADSQDAQFGPDAQLAFTYYRFSARGDICYLTGVKGKLKTFKETDPICLPRSAQYTSSQRSNPFWVSANEIGFLERDFNTQASRIGVYNVKEKSERVLAEGNVWGPSMRPNGKYLIYNELIVSKTRSTRQITLKEISTGRIFPVKVDLPGLSGFPVLSPDEKYLYFSHFLNDTNTDRAIDGNDNSVLFRLPVAALMAGVKNANGFFPEALTSSETSCSYPRPTDNELYATCAFEGSLDIYRLPASGILPADWSDDRIREAHQTARTYEERIFLLNSFKFRSKQASNFDEPLFFDHMESGDTLAARHYLDALIQIRTQDSSFLRQLSLYLEARQLKNAEPSGEVSRTFQTQISGLDRELEKISGEKRNALVVRGLFAIFLNEPNRAERYLRQVPAQEKMRPLERYLYFKLAEALYKQRLPQSLNQYVQAYRSSMTASELPEESRLYYTFGLLTELEAYEPSRVSRIKRLDALAKGLQGPVGELVQAENLSLRLIEASSDPDKLKIYNDLDKLMNQTKSNYFLRKALYVRAILNFAAAADFKHLNLIASNWLRYTKAGETEFIYAREVFSDATLTRAYAHLAEKREDLAANYFYQSLSLTDDLESHFGYLKAMSAKGERGILAERYRNLKNRKFIDDNMKFVEAILILIDNEEAAKKDPRYLKSFEIAREKIQSMTQDRDSAMRYLTLGYVELELLLRTGDGAKINEDLFQSAQRHLLLAYDLSRDNARVRAASLMNLGLLNLRVQNYGLAARFYSQRESYPFENTDDHIAHSWWSARALAHTNQHQRAVEEIDSLSPHSITGPVLERKAFYAATAGKFKEAIGFYEQLFAATPNQSRELTASTKLMYGYALLKANRRADAMAALQESIGAARALQNPKRLPSQLLEPDRARTLVVAYGLLAQSTDDFGVKVSALTDRQKLLEKNGELVDDSKPKLLQVSLQLASLYVEKENAKAVEEMAKALKIAESYGSDNGYLSRALFQTASSQLVFAIATPAFNERYGRRIRALANECVKVYRAQKVKQPLLEKQREQLEGLLARLG